MMSEAVGLLGSVLSLALGASPPYELIVMAEHAGGGFTTSVTWRLTIEDRRGSVFASEPQFRRSFEITGAETERLVAAIEDVDFFGLQSSYGIGDMEGNACKMTISYKSRHKAVMLLVYSKRNPPTRTEAAEVRRAYRIWDALKSIGGLGQLPDDCRREIDIWIPRDERR